MFVILSDIPERSLLASWKQSLQALNVNIDPVNPDFFLDLHLLSLVFLACKPATHVQMVNGWKYATYDLKGCGIDSELLKIIKC